MPPLLNMSATVMCAHGGQFPLVVSGPRPLIGGAPGIVATDLVGMIAAGCVFNVLGAPVPCAIVSVIDGICTKVTYGGQPALHAGIVAMTSNGLPTLPCANPGQATVHGV